EAQALSLLGFFEWMTGDLAGAEATLNRAVLAAEEGKDDEHAARACLTLARTVADEQPSSPQALFWADHAGAWISRLAGALPKLEIYLEDARAAIHWGRGEFAEAERHDLRALELGEKAFGADDVEVAKTLAGLALDYSGVGQLEKALTYARRAIAIKEKT